VAPASERPEPTIPPSREARLLATASERPEGETSRAEEEARAATASAWVPATAASFSARASSDITPDGFFRSARAGVVVSESYS